MAFLVPLGTFLSLLERTGHAGQFNRADDMEIEQARQTIADLGEALVAVAQLPKAPDSAVHQHNAHLTWLLAQIGRALNREWPQTAHEVGVGRLGKLPESQLPPEIRVDGKKVG
jgi:hypothetical protein